MINDINNVIKLKNNRAVIEKYTKYISSAGNIYIYIVIMDKFTLVTCSSCYKIKNK